MKFLVLVFLLGSCIGHAGGAALSRAVDQGPSISIGDVRIVSDNMQIRAMKGTHVLWRSDLLMGAQLTTGPGRWITATGIPTALTLDLEHVLESGGPFDVRHSIVFDPLNGKMMAEVDGTLLDENSDLAVFLDLRSPPIDAQKIFLTLTFLSLKTFAPRVTHLSADGIFPKQCLALTPLKDGNVPSSSMSSLVSFATPIGTLPNSSAELRIQDFLCDVRFQLNLATSKITLISFKRLK
jgi:hypothetical protein